MQITERYRRRDFGHMDLEMTFSLRSLRCAHTFAASLMLNGTLRPGGRTLRRKLGHRPQYVHKVSLEVRR